MRTFSGKIVLDGGEPLEFSCVDGTPSAVTNEVWCQLGGLMIHDVSVESIQLAITSAAGDFSGTFAPSYEPYYPNGEECSPTCQHARERVVVAPAVP